MSGPTLNRVFFSLATLLVSLPTIICGQETKPGSPQDASRIAELDRWFPRGQVEAVVLDRVELSPRRAELMGKMLAAIQKDPELVLREPPKKIDSAYAGLTEAEWKEYGAMCSDGVKLVGSDSMNVTIDRRSDTIVFYSAGRLPALDQVKINPVTNEVWIGGYLLPFESVQSVTDSVNGLRSWSHGYRWQFAEPEPFPTPKTMDEVMRTSYKLYTLTILRLERDGSIYMNVAGSEVSMGQRVVKFAVPIGLKERR